MANLRRVGDITLDMEKLLSELSFGHDLQHGEVLSLIHNWLLVHAPSQRETYTEDGSHPTFYYGYPEKQQEKK